MRVLCCSKQGQYQKHSRGTLEKKRLDTRINCEAKVVIKLFGNIYHLVEFKEDHNHELAPPSQDARLGTLVDSNGEPLHVECYPSLSLQSSELTHMTLKIARKGVSSTKCMEFTKGCLARVQEEVDKFLKANPEEVTNLEGDEKLSTTKVGEVTNQDLIGANITLRVEPRKKRNGKAGRIKGALEKGKGKKGLAQCKMVIREEAIKNLLEQPQALQKGV
ncbi:hypothetical protein GIB67_026597 [Kingdonia uniflora]|uniref:FAR1 domain-containing protein n=1 Tax=Kingdonia uniflora TaxID=39325 RepID=A0A7J7NND6_9MAGN|nr:hypothetical protein GIB67_026597 [Kingdonia uniflora]